MRRPSFLRAVHSPRNTVAVRFEISDNGEESLPHMAVHVLEEHELRLKRLIDSTHFRPKVARIRLPKLAASD